MSVYKELGTKLKNFISTKTEEVDDKVEAIDKHERYVNTDLDSCFCKLAEDYTPIAGDYVPFTKISGSFEVTNGRVMVKSGQRVQINVSMSYYLESNIANILYEIKDYTNDICITNMHPHYDSTYEYDFTSNCQYTNNTDKDCEIGVYVYAVYQSDNLIKTLTTMTIQEIGRQIVIDPVEHINESHGIEDTPVGHIIAHMGTIAPKHYLICDGTEYNITDYPYLPQHIEDNFGSINFFGGDGETTFAVPDLRGEFLRGTGVNSRSNQGNGSSVGTHQDATEHINIEFYQDAVNKYRFTPAFEENTKGTTRYSKKRDTVIINGKYTCDNIILNNARTWNNSPSFYTSRPTNTSVLYCIKYEPTYFMNTYNTNYMQTNMYSEEEKVVGCWTNGKPIYRKVIPFTFPTSPNVTVFKNVLPEDMEFLVSIRGKSSGINQTNSNMDVFRDFPFYLSANDYVSIYVNYRNIYLYAGSDVISWNATNSSVFIVEYTKSTDEKNSFTTDMIKDYVVHDDAQIAEMRKEINELKAIVESLQTSTLSI